MPTLAPDVTLRWSDRKIAETEQHLETLMEGNFVHWTQKAELFAARGDSVSARSCIEHALKTWSAHHGNNDHFVAEIAIAALLSRCYDIVYDTYEQRYTPDWKFAIEIVDGLSAVPFVMEWEVESRTRSVFRFDASAYQSDDAHVIFLNWIWSFQLFDAYHRSLVAIAGKTLFTLGDMAVAPGLAFSANRADAFLIPDSFFLSKYGYSYPITCLDRNRIVWADRRPVAFWRGGTTGIRAGGWRSLQRVRLCETAAEQQDGMLFDVGISHAAQLSNPEWIAELEASGLMRAFVPSEQFGAYKYLIDIDGNSSSWEGLFLKLYTGIPVLKVASPSGFRQWYYDELKPWVNYVPVEADMADLAENVAWLRAHDDQAELIGKRGRALARSLTYDGELARSVHTIKRSIRFFREDDRLIRPGPGGGT